MNDLQIDISLRELSQAEMELIDGSGLWGEFAKALGMDLLVDYTIEAINAAGDAWSAQVANAGMYSGGYTNGYSSNPYH